MKKRFLSAALALAMVLALLPVSVMPASAAAADKDSATYYATENTTITGTDWDGPGWYAKHVTPASGSTPASTTYSKITSGFIVGSTYYSSIVDDAGKLRSTSFTVIGGSQDVDAGNATSLTIDIYNGPSGTAADNLIGTSITVTGSKLTSLTVTDSKYATEVNTGIRAAAENRGTVTLTAFTAVTDRAITNLSLSDVVTASNISLTGLTKNASGVTTGVCANKITLTNAETGTITMGSTYVNPQTSLNVYANQQLSANRRDVQVKNAPGNEIGEITMLGNSQVTLWDTTLGANDVSITGAGSKLTVEGNTTGSGNITLVASTNSKTTSGAVNADINGTGATGIGTIQGDATNEKSTSNFTINVKGSSVVAGIDLTNAAITVDNATVEPAVSTNVIKLKNGSLAIKNGATVGDVQFQENGAITNFSVTGSNNTVGAVSVNTKNTFTTVNIEANNTNTFTSLGLGNYSGHGVKGGTFGTNIDHTKQKDYLASGMAYQLKNENNKFQYFPGTSEGLSNAIAAGGANAKNGLGNLVVLGTDITTPAAISAIFLKDGSETIANIGYTAVGSSVVLPKTVNGVTYESWTVTGAASGDGSGNEYKPGQTFTANTVQNWTLNAQAAAGSVTKITTAANKTATAPNKDVTVKLNGNAITLSGGAKDSGGGSAVFRVELTTDLVDKDGSVIKPEIGVNWNGSKAVFDRESNPGYGITFPDENTLRLSNGTTYTVNGSGLRWLEGDGVFTTVPDNKLVVTVTDPNYKTEGQKNGLIASIVGTAGTDSSFTYTSSPALNQAVNAVAATITESQVNSWRTTAQRAAWQAKKGNIQAQPADLTRTGFVDVELQVYLAVTVTKANPLTMNLVPSYRVVVKNPSSGEFENALMGKPNTDANYNYVARTGTLGTLAGDLTEGDGTGGVVVKLNISETYAHQDSTYGYKAATKTFTFTHAGKTGLGTVVFNNTEPVVKLTRQIGAKHPDGTPVTGAAATYYYDSLQAAVDDTLPQPKDKEDKIEVGKDYQGNGAISVSGLQRIFKIETKGNTTIQAAASGDVTVTNPGSGHEYTIQLLKDYVTAANIIVTTVENGVAIVNTVNAKPGQEVEVTVTPKEGYRTKEVTAKTNAGVKVPVTNKGNNVFAFNVPTGATRVDVTPVFLPIGALPFTDVPTDAAFYTAVQYCYEHNLINGKTLDKFAPYSTITRVEIVTILWRQAGAPTYARQGLYKDMPSNNDYYNAVIWATKNGIAQGYEDGKFYPARAINRQELATFLYRYQVTYLKRAAAGSVANLNGYTDGYRTGSWAQPAMRWAVGNGIVTGVGNSLSPTSGAPRYEAATAMYQYCNGVLGIK